MSKSICQSLVGCSKILEGKKLKNITTDLGFPFKKYGNKENHNMSSVYWTTIKSYGDLFYTSNHCLIFSYNVSHETVWH